ncbi:hypothetical protein [Abyssisolibacter fermentans]|uniref:hypothetical protein n=1 Tax=Abyssisolibacter fermentans TaxID=1766203 RepID=UPI0008313BE7|nr:hypothetical protein [Abyssisolibacter fermentans]
MKNKTIWRILCIIICIFFIYKHFDFDLNKAKGCFSDIVLDKYKEATFDELIICKDLENYRYDIRDNRNNISIANKLLDYFKNLEIVEIQHSDIPKGSFINKLYTISFKQSKTYNDLVIYVLNEEYLMISQSVLVKKIDEKKKIITYEDVCDGIQRYRIINSKLDLDYIEKVFLSLNKR